MISIPVHNFSATSRLLQRHNLKISRFHFYTVVTFETNSGSGGLMSTAGLELPYPQVSQAKLPGEGNVTFVKPQDFDVASIDPIQSFFSLYIDYYIKI